MLDVCGGCFWGRNRRCIITHRPTIRIEGGRRLREGARSTLPLVSIVNVFFNAAPELVPLFETIVAQLGKDIEWIVIDGRSTDGTVELLRQFDDKIDYWLSEPDRGIYDAMNKGIAAATGEYILHLNAGDRLLCIPSDKLRRCQAEGVDVACFSVDMEGWGSHRPRAGFLLRIANAWHHQGVFYRRQRHPGYDLQYRVFSDFDCNQKMMKAGSRVALFTQVVAEQQARGISGSGVADEEKARIVRANFGAHYVALAWIWHRFEGFRVRLKQALTWWESRKGK